MTQEGGPGILLAFSSPYRAVAKIIMQTAGELDYETIFNQADLLYSPMAYVLFITFVVIMPILFSNLLVCTVCSILFKFNGPTIFMYVILIRLVWLLETHRKKLKKQHSQESCCRYRRHYAMKFLDVRANTSFCETG